MKIPYFSNLIASLKIARELQKEPAQVQAFIRSSLHQWQLGSRGLDLPYDYVKLVNEYTGWAYACAQKNAAGVAQIPLRLYRGVSRTGKMRDVPVRKVSKPLKNKMFSNSSLVPVLTKAVDIEEVVSHPWLDLLAEVNQDLNGFSLRMLTMLFKQVTGNAYWLVPKTNNGTPLSIWVLPSQLTRIVPDPATFIKEYTYGLSEPKERFPKEDIVHFKYVSPKSLYYGMGPLEAAFTSAALSEDFEEYERHILENGAVMTQLFTSDEPLSEPVIKRFTKELNKTHQGLKNVGKFAVLQGGIKALPTSWNPKDINYAIGLKVTKEKIAGIFGVPLSKLTVEDVNRANAEAGNYSYMKDTVEPECTQLADQINQDIMPYYDEKLFVMHDDCVPEDKEFKLRMEESRLRTGVYWINAVREEEGLDPIEGGDEPLLANNLTPLSRILNPPEPVPFGLGDEEESEEEEAVQPEKQRVIKGPKDAVQFYARPVDIWLKETQAIAADHVSEFTCTSVSTVEAAIPWHEIEKAGAARLLTPAVYALEAAAKDAIQKLPGDRIGIAFSMRSPEAIEYAKRHIGRRITVINSETRQAIRDIVSRHLSEGMTPQKLARALRSEIGLNVPQAEALSKYEQRLIEEGQLSDREIAAAKDKYKNRLLNNRAEMIARTESAAAYSEGDLIAWKAMGIRSVEHSAANDACPVCAALDGKIYDIHQAEGNIPVHPNCRCAWLPVIE